MLKSFSTISLFIKAYASLIKCSLGIKTFLSLRGLTIGLRSALLFDVASLLTFMNATFLFRMFGLNSMEVATLRDLSGF